jgi:hypothetical protein
MTVELRAVPGDPELLEATVDDVAMGTVRLRVAGDRAQMAAQVELIAGLELRHIEDVVLATVARAKELGATDVEFHSDSLLLRHAAREVGFGGALRVPLHGRVGDVAPRTSLRTSARTSATGPGEPDATAWLSARLHELGVASTPARRSRPLGRLATRLSGGVGDTLDVVVEWAPGRTFRISVPDRPDIMPEGVALTADTAAAVLRRFPDQADAAKAIRFDRAEHGLKSGRYAGVAQLSVPSIHLTIGYVTTEHLMQMMRARPPGAVRTTSASPSSPYTVVDATVAHELWHQIESAFEARHYALSMELRHQIGLELGVQTLEHAVKGANPKAPPAWQSAYRRLAAEVSPYATTNAREATAELFKLWWCRNGPLPPVVARFGELVDQLLPPETALA